MSWRIFLLCKSGWRKRLGSAFSIFKEKVWAGNISSKWKPESCNSLFVMTRLCNLINSKERKKTFLFFFSSILSKMCNIFSEEILVNNFIHVCGYHKVVVTKEKGGNSSPTYPSFSPPAKKHPETKNMHFLWVFTVENFSVSTSDFVKCQNSITKEFQTSHCGGFNSASAWEISGFDFCQNF